MNRPPTEIELFLYTHTKEHPIPTKEQPTNEHQKLTFINERSKKINDNIVRLREEHRANHESGEVEAQVIDESTLFYEAAGGKRKKGVYGNGSNIFNMLNPNSFFNATSSKQYRPSGSKDLKMERKLRKLTKENGALKHTLELVCKHVGIATPEFDPNSGSEDDGEERASADQLHTSTSQAGASH
uniref:uncharacterized protein LOC122579948 n=1 Tax=Erigeron canadensis TaxID=72917 RepID=UPI001CB9CA10|nr:uncharacterized protein LOC122579948 [Erigeron canadensis]